MYKKVEVEYVGVDDLIEILTLAVYATDCGHYVSVHMSSNDEAGMIVSVSISVNHATKRNKSTYDYCYVFSNDSSLDYDVNKMNECKATLNNLLL